MRRFLQHLPLLLAGVIAALCGCRHVDLSAVPLADDLGLVSVEPVPKEIADRFGPTSKDRLDEISRQRAVAKKGSAKIREEISSQLAEQIRTEPNPFLRQEMIRTLTVCDTPTAGRILRQGLNDESTDVQIQCCRGWGKWGTEESVRVLQEVLDNRLTDLDVKIAAIDGIESTGKLAGAKRLVSLLDPGEDPAIQYEAVQALQKMTGQKLANDREAWDLYVAEQIEKAGAEPASRPPSLAERALLWWR